MKKFLYVLFFLVSSKAMAFEAMPQTDYETVAAGQTLQACGPTGSAGDVLDHLIVVPASTSPGAISVSDDANVTYFAGGASSLSNLATFTINVNERARSSTGWKITTGSNIAVICVGRFK